MEDVFGDKLVMFSDLLKLDFPEKTYEEVKDVKKLIKVLDDKLDEYNAELTPMKLVFFSDAIQHILRIVRVLRQPRGNMMLIGVGGCGK
jgi:dynein heavy chain